MFIKTGGIESSAGIRLGMKSSSGCRTWASRARKKALSSARNKATSRLEPAWGATQDHGPRAWAGPETVKPPGCRSYPTARLALRAPRVTAPAADTHRKAQASRLAAAGSPTTSIVAEEDPGVAEAGIERLAGAFLPFSGAGAPGIVQSQIERFSRLPRPEHRDVQVSRPSVRYVWTIAFLEICIQFPTKASRRR